MEPWHTAAECVFDLILNVTKPVRDFTLPENQTCSLALLSGLVAACIHWLTGIPDDLMHIFLLNHSIHEAEKLYRSWRQVRGRIVQTIHLLTDQGNNFLSPSWPWKVPLLFLFLSVSAVYANTILIKCTLCFPIPIYEGIMNTLCNNNCPVIIL